MHLHPTFRRATSRLIVLALALVVVLSVVSWPSSANQPSESQSVAGNNGFEAQARRTRQANRTATAAQTYIQPTATRAVQTTPPPTAQPTAPVVAQPTATIAPQPPANTGSYGCPTGEELTMLGLINNFRGQNGAGPLTLSPTLTNAAEFHSRDMAARNYFSHDLPGIGTWSQNITNHGYPYGTRAENIAAGNSSASATFNQWVNSPGHRANMLNPNLTAIGIGAAYGASSAYGTYWTNTFGSPVDSRLAC